MQVVDVNEAPQFDNDDYTAKIFSIASYKSPVVSVQVKSFDYSSISGFSFLPILLRAF